MFLKSSKCGLLKIKVKTIGRETAVSASDSVIKFSEP